MHLATHVTNEAECSKAKR